MGPDDLLLIVMMIALTLYALLGGADFGAGIWEFTTVFQSTEKQRNHIYRASGQLAITADGHYDGNFITGWVTPISIFTAFYSVGMCAYLAAVYLAREADIAKDRELTQLWRQRSLSTGLWMGLLSMGGLVMVALETPMLAEGFLSRGWPLVLVSLACGIGSLIETWRGRYLRAVIASSGAVTAVLWGWATSQHPVIVPPTITSEVAQSPDNILWTMLVVIGIGAVLLLPSLAYLFFLFKSSSALAPVADD